MARPTRDEAIVKRKRDEDILAKREKGYPVSYIATFHGLTRRRVFQILKRSRVGVSGNEDN